MDSENPDEPREIGEGHHQPLDLAELLAKNRSLQDRLRGILAEAEAARKRNLDMKCVCETVIKTRQQHSKSLRTARPIKAPISLERGEVLPGPASMMDCSFWSRDGVAPKLSDESEKLRTALLHVPPCFKQSFAWSARETESLCHSVLSVVQEKLGERVFEEAREDPDFRAESLRDGVEECRRVRLDSGLAAETARGFGEAEWEQVSLRTIGRRSAEECRIQWTCFVRPDRNRAPFSKEEAMSLQEAAERHGLTDWKSISEEIGTGRHPAECLRFYRQHFGALSRRWTKAEDDRILKAWREGGRHKLKMAALEMDRDVRVAMYRLDLLLKKDDIKRGPWSQSEDLSLLKVIRAKQPWWPEGFFQGVLKHGTRWKLISEDLKRRTPEQCRERFVYHLRPSSERERRSRWTEEDVSLLKELAEDHLEKFGTIKWSKMAESFENKGISARDLLNKWNHLLEREGGRTPSK